MEDLFEVGGRRPEGSLDPKNYAGNPSVEDRVRRTVLNTLDHVRKQRTRINEIWERLYKVYLGKHDIRLYKGHSDVFVPMTTKIVETGVSQTKPQLFPEAQTLMVEPTDELSAELQPGVQLTLEHDVEQAKVRQKMDLMLRLAFIYGPAVVKSRWLKRTVTNRKRVRTFDATEQQNFSIFGPVQEDTTIEPHEVAVYEGPTFEVVDPLRFYVHPITARDIDDARLVWEDITVDWNHLKGMEEAGIYKEVGRVRDLAAGDQRDARSPEIDGERDTRLNFYGYSAAEMAREEPARFRLTEIWGKFDLYGTGRLIDCKIVAVGDVILEVRQNPLFSNRPPYRMSRVFELMDNVYGRGIVEQLEHMQYAFNALVNQAMDSGAMQINPPIGVDINRLNGELGDLTIAPLALLPTLGPPRETFSFFRPPNTMETALNLANVFAGFMQDMGFSPPIAQGKTGGRDLSATEADILRSGAGAFTSNMAAKFEADILTPMLHDWYLLEQQFSPRERTLKITGTPPVRINRQDLVGDYTFKWYTAGAALQRQVVVQQRGGGITAGPPGEGQETGGIPGGEGTPGMGAPPTGVPGF